MSTIVTNEDIIHDQKQKAADEVAKIIKEYIDLSGESPVYRSPLPLLVYNFFDDENYEEAIGIYSKAANRALLALSDDELRNNFERRMDGYYIRDLITLLTHVIDFCNDMKGEEVIAADLDWITFGEFGIPRTYDLKDILLERTKYEHRLNILKMKIEERESLK